MIRDITSGNTDGTIFSYLYNTSAINKTDSAEEPLVGKKELLSFMQDALNYNQLYTEGKSCCCKPAKTRIIDRFSDIYHMLKSPDTINILKERIKTEKEKEKDKHFFTEELRDLIQGGDTVTSQPISVL